MAITAAAKKRIGLVPGAKRSWGRGGRDDEPGTISLGAVKKGEDMLEACGGSPGLLREIEGRVLMEISRGFEAIETQANAGIIALLNQYRIADEKVERIKKKYAVKRDPEIDPNRASTDYMIASVLILEVIANGLLYGNHSSSLVAGVVPALVPSLVQLLLVGGGVLAARHATVGTWLRRGIGGALALVCGVACLPLLFGFAHFRESVVGGIEGYRSAVHHLVAAPLDLSTTSWLMFAMTTAISAIVAFKFWTTRDHVPGLDKAARALEDVAEEVDVAAAALRIQMKAMVEAETDKVGRSQMTQRADLMKARKFYQQQLRKVGIRDPLSHEISDEDSPEVIDMLEGFVRADEWLRENQDLGDLRVVFGHVGEGSDGYEPEVREVENLPSARTTAEGWLWLDKVIARFGFRSTRTRDGGEK